MQFVEHDAFERAEQERRIGGREQERELLRRREQDVWRVAALALALRRWRVAGARFESLLQPHFAHRDFQIARDIDGKRFERRDVERVQPTLAADIVSGRYELPRRTSWGREFHQARQKSGER